MVWQKKKKITWANQDLPWDFGIGTLRASKTGSWLLGAKLKALWGPE